jgi:hypothetical protein
VFTGPLLVTSASWRPRSVLRVDYFSPLKFEKSSHNFWILARARIARVIEADHFVAKEAARCVGHFSCVRTQTQPLPIRATLEAGGVFHVRGRRRGCEFGI